MIHVDRPLADSKLRERALLATRALQDSVARKVALKRDETGIWHSYAPVLRQMFRDKCSYCETPLNQTYAAVDQFRPKSLYWWLAYEWNNLLIACQACNLAKSDRFPIAGSRALSPNSNLALEQPLLLDPTNPADVPNEHLYFHQNGRVTGVTERGRVTIDTLGLNRLSLIDDRAYALRIFSAGNQLLQFLSETEIRATYGPDQPFVGAKQQVFWRLQSEKGQPAQSGQFFVFGPVLSQEEIENLQKRAAKDAEQKASFTIESEDVAATNDYRLVSRRIERVTFTNFKSLASLTVEIPQPTKGEAWLMLLGENGVGKSSILQGIALALMGEQHANSDALDLDASRFHRNQAKAKTGSVEITLANLPQPIRLEFRRGQRKFKVDPPEPKVLLLAYGSTRLLPRKGLQEVDQNRYIRIKNLFDPTAPLNDAEKWLCDTAKVTKQRFDEVASAIRETLLLPETAEPTRENGKLEFRDGDTIYRLDQLSDGYQSITAMVADIAFCVLEKWPTIAEAEGVVLIDEIEVHLHPRWKMTIVERLRRAFPRLCFIVTTHDPLCLRGLYKGEIVVLRKDGSINTDIPDLDGYRVDQLLTSQLFDLTSTRGPRTSRDSERYAELLRKPKLTKDESAELGQIEDRIAALTYGERVEPRP